MKYWVWFGWVVSFLFSTLAQAATDNTQPIQASVIHVLHSMKDRGVWHPKTQAVKSGSLAVFAMLQTIIVKFLSGPVCQDWWIWTNIDHTYPSLRENDQCCGALMCHGGPCGLRGLLQAADLLPSQTMWTKYCSGSKEMEWMWPNWLVESTCAASANRTPFWKAWVIGVLRIACVALVLANKFCWEAQKGRWSREHPLVPSPGFCASIEEAKRFYIGSVWKWYLWRVHTKKAKEHPEIACGWAGRLKSKASTVSTAALDGELDH